MSLFLQTVSVVGPIVGGIMLLGLFFTMLGWAAAKGSAGTTRFAVKGMFDERTRVTVHMAGGSCFEDVCILGFIEPASGKNAFPYELGRMLLLEHADGRRILVQAKMVRQIEAPQPTNEYHSRA